MTEEIELRLGDDVAIVLRSDTLSMKELIEILEKLKDKHIGVVLPDEDEGLDVV